MAAAAISLGIPVNRLSEGESQVTMGLKTLSLKTKKL
jgi:hypothetical protein